MSMLPTYQSKMRTAASTPATSHHERGDEHTPGRFPVNPVQGPCVQTDQQPTKHGQPASTQDFYRDTFFNPIWTSGPNVFSFASDGTIVRPETYAPKPYPGCCVDRAQRFGSASASCSLGFVRRDPKPWKNVAITEQDDQEWEQFKERVRVGALSEYRHCPAYLNG